MYSSSRHAPDHQRSQRDRGTAALRSGVIFRGAGSHSSRRKPPARPRHAERSSDEVAPHGPRRDPMSHLGFVHGYCTRMTFLWDEQSRARVSPREVVYYSAGEGQWAERSGRCSALDELGDRSQMQPSPGTRVRVRTGQRLWDRPWDMWPMQRWTYINGGCGVGRSTQQLPAFTLSAPASLPDTPPVDQPTDIH